jgi:hypothetical protein
LTALLEPRCSRHGGSVGKPQPAPHRADLLNSSIVPQPRPTAPLSASYTGPSCSSSHGREFGPDFPACPVAVLLVCRSFVLPDRLLPEEFTLVIRCWWARRSLSHPTDQGVSARYPLRREAGVWSANPVMRWPRTMVNSSRRCDTAGGVQGEVVITRSEQEKLE